MSTADHRVVQNGLKTLKNPIENVKSKFVVDVKCHNKLRKPKIVKKLDSKFIIIYSIKLYFIVQ